MPGSRHTIVVGVGTDMRTVNLLHETNDFYRNIYDYRYHQPVDIELRQKDAWPALCYAHGIRDALHLPNLADRIKFVRQRALRVPRSVLEIGSGQGELSAVFSHLGYPVQSVDVCDAAEHYHLASSRAFFNTFTDDTHTLYIGSLEAVASSIAWHSTDTVVLVETIEHILADEWWWFFDQTLAHLRHNQARLIITNKQSLHPIPPSPPDHVTLIDDEFYDRLSSAAVSVFLRQGSHLVLDF